MSVLEKLGKKEFVEDPLVDDLLIFSTTDFHANRLYLEGRIILQDKVRERSWGSLNYVESKV